MIFLTASLLHSEGTAEVTGKYLPHCLKQLCSKIIQFNTM